MTETRRREPSRQSAPREKHECVPFGQNRWFFPTGLPSLLPEPRRICVPAQGGPGVAPRGGGMGPYGTILILRWCGYTSLQARQLLQVRCDRTRAFRRGGIG